MHFKFPENDDRYYWTDHVKRKMVFYGLSTDRIKRIIRNPKRVEEGVTENTVAVMIPGANKKKPSEIWVMYQKVESRPACRTGRKWKVESSKIQNQKPPSTLYALPPKLIIISAWRYPGISPVGKAIPVPEEILEELRSMN